MSQRRIATMSIGQVMCICILLMAVVIGRLRPFPDIANHVIQAIRIGCITTYRRNPSKMVSLAVLQGKITLPVVGTGCAMPVMRCLVQ